MLDSNVQINEMVGNGILNDLSDELENILSVNEDDDDDSDNIDSDEQDEYELRLIALRSLINKSLDNDNEDLVELEKSFSDFEVIDEADYSDSNDDDVDSNNQNIGNLEVNNQKEVEDEICHMTTDKENQMVKKFQNTEDDEDEDILRAMLLASVSKKIAKIPNNVVS